MKSSLLELKDFESNKEYLGGKTLNLKRCINLGLNVPKFVAIPSSSTRDLLSSEALRLEVANQADSILSNKKYAIRSSALVEDGLKNSFAGQFLTKINVSKQDLSCNLEEVLKQANDFLAGNLDNFSVIIQEYIEADVSGVTFTRSPGGDREMVINYGFCEGEKIVSGQITPNTLSFYWSEEPRSASNILTKELIAIFKNIEKEYSFPQDIEWCIKNGQFYLLQTRPITTISPDKYQQILFLDRFLENESKYFYEKTEISEVAARPVTLTLDLLHKIYAPQGPVAEVYKKFNVQYLFTDFLHIIGNELFIDKEKEVQGLLPAYSYFKNPKLKLQLANYAKLFPTIKNVFYLNSIKINNHDLLFEKLRQAITAPNPQDLPIDKQIDGFLKNYKLIFETNLLSGLSIKKTQAILQREPVTFTEILSTPSLFIDLSKYKISAPGPLTGNSLDFIDETAFTGCVGQKESSNQLVLDWWQNISIYKKNYFGKRIIEALIYSQLRELGRILMLKNINTLRYSVIELASKLNFKESKSIYFSTFNEIITNTINEELCVQRKELYSQHLKLSLPTQIRSSFLPNDSVILGVSAGQASGILQTKDFIDQSPKNGDKYILYTETLSPDITTYFDKLAGIVSKNGGLLSHLAIMAREKGLPVITGVSLADQKISLGSAVSIDGGKGTILVKG
jgi:phosphohistidine swiveling domain-containing protein